VFTLPKPFRSLAKMNENFFYNLLFKAASMAIKDWFAHKHNIRPGIVCVLHTAGSDLKYHPHIHMIVSGGGQIINSNNIVELKSDYLTKQRFLANKFKQFFFKFLFKEVEKGKLIIYKKFHSDINSFFNWARDIRDQHWIVNIQKPLRNIEKIIGYVGRYTKRACISEYKITHVDNNSIKFVFKDYKNSKHKANPILTTVCMNHAQFFDALLQHVPNKKFTMISYPGLYSSHYRKLINQINSINNNCLKDNDI